MKIRLLLFFLFTQTAFCQQQIDFGVDDKGDKIPCGENILLHVQKEFRLDSIRGIKYKIDLKEDKETILYKSVHDNVWTIKDTLDNYTNVEGDIRDCSVFCPAGSVEDFNKDGYNDFIYFAHTNVNGNFWVMVYLFNPKTNDLQLLWNDAEDSDIWSDPHYNSKKGIVTCTEVCGQFGVEFRSTYMLKGMEILPLVKKEYDRTELDIMTGKGAKYRKYKGQGKKWKLVKEKNAPI